MFRSQRPGVVSCVVVVALVGAARLRAQDAPCSAPHRYEVSEIPGLGGPTTHAVAVDDAGRAALSALDPRWIPQAVLWAGGEAVALAGEGQGAALGLSSDGRVAGWRVTSAGRRGAVWSGSGVSSLPPLQGHAASAAADVNSGGVAVGWSLTRTGDGAAVVWRGGRPVRLSPGPQGVSSLAVAINDAGQIVGHGDFVSAPYRRALRWDGQQVSTLPGLGGGYDGAAAISEDGRIAGASLHPLTSKYHAVVWRHGVLQDLGLLRGAHSTSALGVNDCGTVVGAAVVDASTNRTVAVAWHGGAAQDLNGLVPADSGWSLRSARAVNNRGQIVGVGQRSGSAGERAFLLTPVP